MTRQQITMERTPIYKKNSMKFTPCHTYCNLHAFVVRPRKKQRNQIRDWHDEIIDSRTPLTFPLLYLWFTLSIFFVRTFRVNWRSPCRSSSGVRLAILLLRRSFIMCDKLKINMGLSSRTKRHPRCCHYTSLSGILRCNPTGRGRVSDNRMATAKY